MMATPKIRFKGYTHAWEQRKLGEVADKLKSYSLSRDVESEDATGFRYIHYGDIHKQRADIITSDEQLPSIKAGDYIPLRRGDVVVADASEDYVGIAEPSVIMHEPADQVIAGLHTIAMRPTESDSLYLYYLLHTEHFKKYGGEVGTGLKVFGITFSNLAKYETGYPTLPEQTAIGSFFRTLDDTITLHKRKLEGLRELKRGYLQRMLPREGERVPRVRFAGFGGEWEERKLGEVLTERNVQQLPSIIAPLVSFTVENGVTPKSERYNREFLVRTDNKKYKYTKFDDIVYNPANLKFGAISRNKYGDAAFSPIYVTFEVNEPNLPSFVEMIVTSPSFIEKSLSNH